MLGNLGSNLGDPTLSRSFRCTYGTPARKAFLPPSPSLPLRALCAVETARPSSARPQGEPYTPFTRPGGFFLVCESPSVAKSLSPEMTMATSVKTSVSILENTETWHRNRGRCVEIVEEPEPIDAASEFSSVSQPSRRVRFKKQREESVIGTSSAIGVFIFSHDTSGRSRVVRLAELDGTAL